jgi:hypothetical protein
MKGRAVKWLTLLGSAVFVLLALSAGTRVMAQQYFGIIVGTITDPSGAAVPDCTVTATNVNTRISRTAKTDVTGGYRFESLIPGPYTIKAEKTGFQTAEVTAQELHVAGSLTINVTLQIGAVTQEIEVQAVAPLLNTTNATVGTTINNSNVLEMPLNGRAYTDLLELIPGSVNNGAGIYQATGSNYSVSGNRFEQNDYTLDGVSNNEQFFKAYGIQPAIDSIQEFQVRTNISSAEFGEAAGANVAVATKSGTNQIHGSAYEFVRNDKFDATEFFDDRAAIPKTPLRRNQYGVTGGGPIYIPKLYNGHDKAFWFFNYEGVKVREASTQLGTIPTTAQFAGDLTDQPPIYDPTTATQIGTSSSGTPIYSEKQISCNGVLNTICPSRFDAFNTAYAALWYPHTNLLAENAPGGYNSVVTSPYSINQYQLNGRIDYKFKDNLQFFGRYTDQKQIAISPYNIADDYNTLDNHFQNGMVSLTWLASPTTVLDLKSSVNRTLIFTVDNDRGWASFLANHPIDGTPVQNSKYPLFPQLYWEGWSSPSQTGNPFLSSIWQELASVSMIRGRHSMKVGFEFNYFQGWTDGLFTSIFGYGSIQTSDPNPADTATTGSSLASFLLGIPYGGTRNVGITAAYMRDKTEALYFQDDIKLTRKLTLNAGLRWEYDKWPTEVHNHLSEFDFSDNKFVWAGPNPLLGVGPNISDPSLMRPDYRAFAPRLGLAYALTPKTTLRSGFGMFYGSNYYWEGQGARGTWPYAISDTLEGLNAPGSTIVYTEHMYPTYNAPVPGTPADAQHTMARYNRTPYSVQWNFGVQRELANNLMLEVEYVGDGGRHMPLFTNENDPQPGPGTVGMPGHFRPYQYADPVLGTYPTSPGFGADSEMDNVATSAYHALQVKLEKKFSNGLQFLASYAWGHYIDEGGSGFSQGAAPQIDNNFAADRADGTFDMRHIFTANWVYDLPAGYGRRFLSHGNKLLQGVLGGWEFTGITHFNTGGPLGMSDGIDIANIGQRSGPAERPNLVPGQPQRTTPGAGVDQTTGYLNPLAFTMPAPYTYGNLGRNTARNLGMQNFDLGLYKNFPIHENRQSIQFRAEFFNAFNHVNLGGIDGTITDTTFGSVGWTQNDSREIQLALKLYF